MLEVRITVLSYFENSLINCYSDSLSHHSVLAFVLVSELLSDDLPFFVTTSSFAVKAV